MQWAGPRLLGNVALVPRALRVAPPSAHTQPEALLIAPSGLHSNALFLAPRPTRQMTSRRGAASCQSCQLAQRASVHPVPHVGCLAPRDPMLAQRPSWHARVTPALRTAHGWTARIQVLEHWSLASLSSLCHTTAYTLDDSLPAQMPARG